jgi:fatty acid/phospholipid biosynthesis enzyme
MAIALDAMGGDLAPAATVKGALRARRERGLEVILVATDARLRVELRRRLSAPAAVLRIHNVPEVLVGEVYARRILAVARASIGVVANGGEEEKGTDRTRAAAAALRKPGSRVHFTIEDELEEAAQRAAGLFEKNAA